MKLIAFSVEKYRSILTKSTLPVSSYTAILGPNNRGKSNLLRGLMIALETLQDMSEPYPRWEKRGGKLYCELRRIMDEKYSWKLDFPIALQDDKRGDKNKKVSRFIVEFLLEGNEHQEFRRAAGFSLNKKVIPIRLEFGMEEVAFSLKLKGRAFVSLSSEGMQKVANFVTSRINVCFIDAERTAITANRSITRLIRMPVRRELQSKRIRQILNAIGASQSRILQGISKDLESSLKDFLPEIRSATVVVGSPSISSGDPDIRIDDGVDTSLSQKGSGIQSLIAISIARYVSENRRKKCSDFVLAIEEPETHLHPDAIHQVRTTLKKIAEQTPVIVTTHSPLLVNMEKINANIIVNDNAAKPAATMDQVRTVLGVWRSDNLSNSDCVIIVEGQSDVEILKNVLSAKSKSIADSFKSGRLSIWNAHGCSGVLPLVRMAEGDLCRYHIVLDNDGSGTSEYGRLMQNHVLERNVTMLRAKIGSETEIEDAFRDEVLIPAIKAKYSIVDISALPSQIKSCKWSVRIKMAYEKAGGVWSDAIEDDIKTLVAKVIAEDPIKAVKPDCEPLFEALRGKVELLMEGC
mgnify:CR=1 FL=1